MIIRRTPEQLKNSKRYGGVYEIELTNDEIYEAYSLQKREMHAEDIAQNIYERIDTAGLGHLFADDFPRNIGDELADELSLRLEDSHQYNEAFADCVGDLVKRRLKELGYDPDTMERRK